MGTKAATDCKAHPGVSSLCLWFKRRATRLARVVLPKRCEYQALQEEGQSIPEPGIPDTAMRTRWEAGVCWYLSCRMNASKKKAN